MDVNVFLAMSKDAIPPIAFLRCEKYEVGLDKTISMHSNHYLIQFELHQKKFLMILEPIE